MKSTALFAWLALFAQFVVAQTSSNTTCSCSWDFPTQMGSGGGVLMFFLGFMTGCLVIGLIWLLVDQRWRSWHVWGHAPEAAPAAQYAPLYNPSAPAAYPAQDQGAPPGYPPPGYPPPQQAGVWALPGGLSTYRTQYDVLMPPY
jgi:hypothetical protein